MTRPLTEWDTEPIIRDPDEEYRVLERSLRRVKGFGLYFVVCSPFESKQIITKMKATLPQKRTGILYLPEEIYNLYQIIELIPDKDKLNILFITGLEYSLNAYIKPGYGGEGNYYNLDSLPPLLGHLNLQRERFRDTFNFCFVFLIPRFAHKFLIRRAPDFYDWSSGYFEFPMNAELLKTEVQSYQVEQDFEEYENLTPQERYQKTLGIEALLDEPELSPETRANLLVEQGKLLLVSEDYEHSLKCFENAGTISPDNYKAVFYTGLVLSDLGRFEEALTKYDQLLTIKNDWNKAWNNRGITLLELGQVEQAIKSYDQALALKPDDHRARNNRAGALFELGRYEEAIADYDQALTIKPDKTLAFYGRSLALWRLGRLDEALASIDQALILQPDDEQILNVRGAILGDLGRFEEALDCFDRALVINPTGDSILNNRAILLSNLGRTEEAIMNLDKALVLNPNDDAAWNNRGIFLGTVEQLEESLFSFDKVIDLKPDNDAAWYNRAVTLWQLNRLEEALASYNQAIALNPEEPLYQENKKELLSQIESSQAHKQTAE
ncbi:MAG: tetratricopeptide repeat protein [Oscillatoriophycideae cyanobacterium NC_groundwater_1537_Pr4_S-0.65um_50_18]|nr:tetratricopeptide repeat protein [Oscillatoriophycideae cyanobacterium NC_groundwater_1537_Pr4_S-0.65um_50_18]